ncbi:MAG TPA: hypothetical protein PK167_11600, partial [Prolixibacteraceae bacterium]|nr:hypothetical protein [Prolixibacteraceae bacterium]
GDLAIAGASDQTAAEVRIAGSRTVQITCNRAVTLLLNDPKIRGAVLTIIGVEQKIAPVKTGKGVQFNIPAARQALLTWK